MRHHAGLGALSDDPDLRRARLIKTAGTTWGRPGGGKRGKVRCVCLAPTFSRPACGARLIRRPSLHHRADHRPEADQRLRRRKPHVTVVLAVIAAVATGFLDINQIRGGKAPEVATTHNGITAKDGQAPAFDVETGTVKVGSKETNVKVPTLEVEPPRNQAAATENKSK